VGMVFMFMSTGALAGTPIAGLFIHDKTIPNFRHLILFSVSRSFAHVMGICSLKYYFCPLTGPRRTGRVRLFLYCAGYPVKEVVRCCLI
jgi:hypothetical protein